MGSIKNLPAPIVDNGDEDLQSIDADLTNLYTTFILPIENLRSLSRPSASTTSGGSSTAPYLNDFSNLQINNTTPLESRAHAFYRMLGLPVIAQDGTFSNSGFNPLGGKALGKPIVLDPALQTIINTRETTAQQLKAIFARQDLSSSIYALVLRYSGPFSVLDPSKTALQADPQTFTVTDRKSEVAYFSGVNSQISDQISATSSSFAQTPVGINYSGGVHLLRPFIVDPRIDATVMPDSRKICVPFLINKAATQISPDTYLMRPGIEVIIQDRLQDQISNTTFLNDVQKILSGTQAPSATVNSLNLSNIYDTIAALADQNNLQGTDINDIFSSFTEVQAETVTRLISVLKSVVQQLIKAQQVIDTTKMQINWVPVPSALGPELGPRGATTSNVGLNPLMSELDLRILELRIKKLNADSPLLSRPDLGTFASPFTSNLVGGVSYDTQLDEQLQIRNNLSDNAFKAMSIIEIIMGEVSGLGLVDVLAIYTALWSIEMSDLIAFLDDAAYTRLTTNNPALQPLADQARGTDITTALNNFEKKVINILSFADKLLAQQQSSSLASANGGGTV